MNDKREKPILEKGFTLCELIIALGVTAVIMSAAVTLAYALSSATRSSDELMRNDTVLRSSTLRISEMIKHSNLVATTIRGGVVIWTDENTDGKIDSPEIDYIEPSSDGSSIQMLKFPFAGQGFSLNMIRWFVTGRTLYATLIPDCSNVTFTVNESLITVSFDISQDGVSRNHQITATVRCSDYGLL